MTPRLSFSFGDTLRAALGAWQPAAEAAPAMAADQRN
jgi:hypothetical protein